MTDTTYDYDFFVIGGGSGGVRAARIAAQLGAKVGLCEERFLGGTCVNIGCVPKKLMVYGAHYGHAFEDAHAYGWNVQPPSLTWSRFVHKRHAEIARLNTIYNDLLLRVGVTVLRARGVLKDAHTVQVGDQQITARYFLVATGGKPFMPPVTGAEHASVSDAMFELDEFPEHVVIAGGGYIAVEFANIFSGYGAKVTQMVRGPQILRGFDNDVRDHLAVEMQKSGVDLRTSRIIEELSRAEEGHNQGDTTDGDTVHADVVLYATGRRPNTGALGLEEAGVETQEGNGAIVVDEAYRTSVPNIYAVGDVIDKVALTPVALAEGMYVAKCLFGDEKTAAVSYRNIPTAVFSEPPIGTVGLSEEEAREKYDNVVIYRSTFSPMLHTLTDRESKTLMKMVVDGDSDLVLGCHMVGADAAEIVQGLAIAMNCGAKKADFDATIGLHPSAAEEFVTMRQPVS